MPLGLNFHEVAFFAILVAAIVLLVTERLRTDMVALLIVLALVVTGVLSSGEALAGFSSEPAIVIACIFVLSGAFEVTGLSESLGAWIGRLAGRSLTRMLAVSMTGLALFSAVTHHVTVTAVALPVGLRLAKERGVPPSKLLMPLALASSLGTTITIIGTPSFLVASELLRQAGRPGLGVVSMAPIGLAISAIGIVYTLVAGRFLLPARKGTADAASRFRLEDYFTEVHVLPDSPAVGKTIEALRSQQKLTFAVVGWLRNGHRRTALPDQVLEDDDVLLVRTTPEELVAIRQTPGLELEPVVQYEERTPTAATEGSADDLPEQLVQAIVAPNSSLVNRTVGEVDFRHRYGALVLGLWRKRGFLTEQLAQTRLRPGDVLVLQGNDDALARVSENRDFLMMVPFQGDVRRPRHALLAGLIMLATIVVASFDWLTLATAALAGAVAMVLTRCLTARQAYRAIDVRMYVFIAGAIPLGTAMQKSGAADLIAGGLKGAVGGWNETVILLGLFLLVGVIVQFMGSDSATTALLGPLAIALAGALGRAPEAFIMTVAIASVTVTLTPMSHHNLIIYAPGGYRFFDYTRLGAPLTLILATVVAFLAPMVWPG